MNIIEQNAIEEAMILGDFSLANELEQKEIEKILPLKHKGKEWRFSKYLYASPLFQTKNKDSGRLIGIVLWSGDKCEECDGGYVECCKCGSQVACNSCDNGYTDGIYNNITISELYDIQDGVKNDNH